MARRSRASEEFDDSVPFGIVRAWLRRHVDSAYGAACPLCHQHVQRYKRAITFSACRDLVATYARFGENTWFNLPEVLPSKINLEFTKLQYWGLIEGAAPAEKNPDSPGVGWWKITEKGARFVNREIRIARRVYVYNRIAYGEVMDGEIVSISDAVGFDYEELLTGVSRGRLRVV